MAARTVSPQLRARVAGAFYLATSGTAFAEFVRNRLAVAGDPASTAHNIAAAEPMYRAACAADVAGIASYLVVTSLLYGLLRPVSRGAARLAAFFGIVGVAVQAASCIAEFVPLVLLRNPPPAAALGAAQLQAIMLMSLQAHRIGFTVALVFFGCYCAVIGGLIFASTFFPRVLGVLMVVAGAALLTGSFLAFLAPAAARALSPVTLALDGLGELSLMVWLLAAGVNAERWQTRAAGAA